MMSSNPPPVFRFAPSPNGALHLGHAYSALINQRMAREMGGKLLLRIENIDQTRCNPALERQMLEDLHWLGVEWEEEPRRQSDHFEYYADGLETLRDAGLVYPSFMTRGDIKRAVEAKHAAGETWPVDPEGSAHYPGDERDWLPDQHQAAIAASPSHMWRLDMQAAVVYAGAHSGAHGGRDLMWQETGTGPDGESGSIPAEPGLWGDVVLARSDTPTSYHMAVTLDDAIQGITHVVRGRDLFHATAVHRLLQHLLGLPAPLYHHHDLVLADDGRKLSKSANDTSLRALRQAGATPADIQRMVGL